MRRFLHFALAVYLGSQAVEAARLLYANWRSTRGDRKTASQIDSTNAAYRLDPSEAAVLSPHDALIRMRLGLALEEAGRIGEAEKELVRATSYSRKYEPRWTLAGFYFRQNKTEPFWFWAREALSVAYRDPELLFDLAWSMENNGAEIRRRLRPEARPITWRAWLLHAARTGRLDEVEAGLDRLDDIDPAPLVQALVSGRRVRALARIHGHRALDWQAIPQEGVRFEADGREGFTLVLDGRQPEQCDVATRLMLAPGRVDWPIHASFNGLSWRREAFGDEGARITLHYQRLAGETRAAGQARIGE